MDYTDSPSTTVRSPESQYSTPYQHQAGLEVVPAHMQAQEKYYVAPNVQPAPPPPPPPSVTPVSTSYTPMPRSAAPTNMVADERFLPVERRPSRAICGMRPATAILSALLVFVILIAAVGGGVGGSMAVSNARNEAAASCTSNGSAVATTTVTSSAATGTSSSSSSSDGAFIAPTNAFLALDCPNLNNTRQTIVLKNKSYTYMPYCGADYNGVTDIAAIIVYSFHDCLEACSSINFNAGKNNCNGVEFNADMANIVPSNFGTCFLKANTNTPNVKGFSSICAAVLVSSS